MNNRIIEAFKDVKACITDLATLSYRGYSDFYKTLRAKRVSPLKAVTNVGVINLCVTAPVMPFIVPVLVMPFPAAMKAAVLAGAVFITNAGSCCIADTSALPNFCARRRLARRAAGQRPYSNPALMFGDILY